jgi:hypothetical protein
MTPEMQNGFIPEYEPEPRQPRASPHLMSNLLKQVRQFSIQAEAEQLTSLAAKCQPVIDATYASWVCVITRVAKKGQYCCRLNYRVDIDADGEYVVEGVRTLLLAKGFNVSQKVYLSEISSYIVDISWDKLVVGINLLSRP